MNELIPFLEIGGLVFIVFLLLGQRTRLRRVERKLSLLMRFMRVDVNQVIPLSDAVKELAKGGRKIEAIKAYRTETGAGLREAKDAVEKFLDSQP